MQRHATEHIWGCSECNETVVNFEPLPVTGALWLYFEFWCAYFSQNKVMRSCRDSHNLSAPCIKFLNYNNNYFTANTNFFYVCDLKTIKVTFTLPIYRTLSISLLCKSAVFFFLMSTDCKSELNSKLWQFSHNGKLLIYSKTREEKQLYCSWNNQVHSILRYVFLPTK